MTGWSLQDQLAEVINILLDRHPMGLRVLTGEAPPPTTEEIHIMYDAGRASEDLGVRVDGGEHVTRAERLVTDEERFARVIDRAGGWDHIYRVARDWEDYNPQTWRIIEEYIRFAPCGIFRIDNPRLSTMALRFRLSEATILRYRRDFPLDFARVILKSRPVLELQK